MGHLRLTLFVFIAVLHTPTVWTWTTFNFAPPTSSSSSRVTPKQQQRISLRESDGSPRLDKLTILHERSADNNNDGIESRWGWNRRLNIIRTIRRVDKTILLASTSDNDETSDDNNNEVEEVQPDNKGGEIDQFLEKAQQAWKSPTTKISMNKLSKTGARESLLNSYKSGSKDDSSTTKGEIDKGVSSSSSSSSSIPLKGSSLPIGMPLSQKSKGVATKSYGGKWGSKKSFGKGNFSKGSFSGGGILSPPPITKSVAKGTEQSSTPPSSSSAAADASSDMKNSPSLFLKEFAKSKSRSQFLKEFAKSKSTISTTANTSKEASVSTKSKDGPNNNTSEEAFLTLAKEAWGKFFSGQVSQDDYVNMALDAWKETGDKVVTLDSNSAGEQREDDTVSKADAKDGGKDSGGFFFSGLTESLFQGKNKSSGASEKGGDITTKEKSLQKQVIPPSSSSMKKGSILPLKSSGEKQITGPKSVPIMKKGFTSPIKSSGKKQVPSPLSLKKGMLPPKQLGTVVKKNWQGNRGGLSFLKSDKLSKGYKAEKNYNPMKKGISADKIKAVIKGKESSSSNGNKTSSTPLLSLDKETPKLGIQSKFAPKKKLDSTVKKNWQGNRGGLSFLKSDKLSKDYKAENNYNPMKKGISAEKIKGLKFNQVGKKGVDDRGEEEDDEQPIANKALKSTPSSTLTNSENFPSSTIERWSKESLKGSETSLNTNEDVDKKYGSTEGKTTTISITDQGGTDVVNPGRAFIPPPRQTEEKGGFGSGIKFASSKLGTKGAIPLKGGAKKLGSSSSGSAEISSSKSGSLTKSAGAKKLGNPVAGGFPIAKKFVGSPAKKGEISKGVNLPFQKSVGVISGDKTFAKTIGSNGEGIPTSSKVSTDATISSLSDGTIKNKPQATKISTEAKSTQSTSLISEGMTAEEAQDIRKNRLKMKKTDLKPTTVATEGSDTTENEVTEFSDDLTPTTELISDGMTAEEAENLRKQRMKIDGDQKYKSKSIENSAKGGVKKSLPASPLTMKGPMSKSSDEGVDDDSDPSSSDVSVPKSLPMKGGISKGEKQSTLPGKGMPFMKKAPSFSMDKKTLPPLPLKGKGEVGGIGMKKSLGMPPPLAKNTSFDDRSSDGVKKSFPASPLTMKGHGSEKSRSKSSSTPSNSSSDGDVVDSLQSFPRSSSSPISSSNSPPDKVLGKGAAFLPDFAPPPMRGEVKDPNDFSWLESSDAIDVDMSSSDNGSSEIDETRSSQIKKKPSSKEPVKLWGGESFLGTSSSRVYGLGSIQPSKSVESKDVNVVRATPSGVPATSNNKDIETWAKDDDANAARLMDEMNESINAVEKRLIDEMKESMAVEEKRLIEEKTKIAALLNDTEQRLSKQLKKFEKETQTLRADKAKADAEKLEAESRIKEIETARILAETEARQLEQRLAEEKSTLSAKLSDAERARADDEKRLVEEKAKVAALISDAEKKLAIQLEQFEQERLTMNTEKETAATKRTEAQRKVEEADLARMKAEKNAEMLETLLSEQKTKQEKWVEEQRIRMEEMLEKRIAEERSKIDAALAEARANEEARLIEEQKRLAEEQRKQRLAEEKSKLDAEIAAAEEKIRRELQLLESEKSSQETVSNDQLQSLNSIPPVTVPPVEEEKTALPDEALASVQGIPKHTSTASDVLTADVEALELVSMCEADYDSTYSTDSSSDSESCILSSEYPFVSLLRDSSPYIVNHRHSTIVYHIPGDLITDVEKFNSVMDDIALTWLFGMKIVLCVGCRTQVSERLDRLGGNPIKLKSGIRITTDTTLRILEEEAGFCRFEVERQLNRCLRSKGANCNVVSGCFITAKKFGVVDGVDYQHTGYPKTLQTDRINRFISRNDVVLLTPLGFTEDGQALNIKSEQLAGFTSGALKASKVVYFSTKSLVMRGSSNSNDANANQRIQMIQRSNALQILSYHGLKINDKTGFPHWINPTVAAKKSNVQSMLLQMGWATDAIDKGVERAHIITCDDGALLEELFTARRGYGTCISQDDYEAPHPEDQNDDIIADDVSARMIGW